MPKSTILRVAGLITDPSPIGDLPEGALLEARNVVIRRPGVVEPRPGFGRYDFEGAGAEADGRRVHAIFPWRDDTDDIILVMQDGDTGVGLLYSEASQSLISGSLSSAVIGRINAAIAGRSMFVTSEAEVRRLDRDPSLGSGVTSGLSGQRAPFAPFLSTTSAPATSLRWLADGNTVAYRVTVVRTLTSGRVIESAPTGRATLTNSAGAARAVQLDVHFPSQNIGEGDRIRIYRSEQSATGTPTDEMFLVREHELTLAEAVADVATIVDTTADEDRGLALYTNAGQQGLAQENTLPPNAADVALYNGMLFYARARGKHRIVTQIRSIDPEDEDALIMASGVNATFTAASATVTINSGVTVHDGLIGCYVWLTDQNSPEDDGGSTVEALTTITAVNPGAGTVTISPVARGSGTFGDVIISAWIDIDAGTAESAVLYAGPIEVVAEKLFDANESAAYTAESLARVASVTSTTVTAINTSTADVGALVFESVNNDESFALDVHRPEAWSLDVGGMSELGGGDGYIAVSKLDQPDHVPFPANYFLVGLVTEPVYRCVPTRDAMLVFKRDGIYRVSGFTPDTLRVDPLSLTTVLAHPSLVTQYDGDVWALTNEGLVIVTDSGVRTVSNAIGAELDQIVRNFRIATAVQGAFLAGNETRSEVYLGVPETSAASGVTKIYVFNTRTGSITSWDRPNADKGVQDTLIYSGAYVAADDKLYLGGRGADPVDGSLVGLLFTERPDSSGQRQPYDDTIAVTITDVNPGDLGFTCPTDTYEPSVGDIIDQGSGKLAIVTGVLINLSGFKQVTVTFTGAAFTTGAATVYSRVTQDVQWADAVVGEPGVAKHFSWALAFFERFAVCPSFDLDVATEVTPATGTVSVSHTFSSTVDTAPKVFRALIPRDHSRAMRIRPRITVACARALWRLSGLQLEYETMSTRALLRDL